MGMAEASLANANTPSASAHVTCPDVTPTSRSAINRTRNSARWLTTVVSDNQCHRVRASSRMRRRKSAIAESHRLIGFRWSLRRTTFTPRSAHEPSASAKDSFHRANARSVTATISAASPTAPATARFLVTSPSMARIPSATGGRVNLMRSFHTPVASAIRPIAALSKPHVRNMRYATATPSAPPPGTVLAIAVDA